jgi:PAS domain S-box-containing protein
MVDSAQRPEELHSKDTKILRQRRKAMIPMSDCPESCTHKLDTERLILGALMDNIADHIYFKDTHSRFVCINRSQARLFGLIDPAEAVGKTDSDFFSEEHANAALADEQSVLRTGQPILAKEEKETWPDGSETWVSTTKMPWHAPNGQLIGTFGLSRDVTARKKIEAALMRSEGELRRHRDNLEEIVVERTRELRAANEHLQVEMKERARIEQALRLSEQRYRRLLGVSPTYVYTVHMKDGVPATTEHSIGCVLVSGYTPEEYVSNPNLWIAMVHPDDREMVRRFVVNDVARSSMPPIEHRIVRKDGTVRWVRNTVVHYFDEGGRLSRYDGLVEDITERRRAEDLVRDSERLKAIGNLADGVAANFKNIMGIITGSAASISDHIIPHTPAHQDAIRIIDAAKHAGHLIRRLMSVARACDLRSTTTLEPVLLDQVLRETMELIGHSFAEKNIRIIVREISKLPAVIASADQVMDILMNLLMNAAESMPEGGAVSIHGRVRRINSPMVRANPEARPGRFVVLSIRDTGPGIPKEILPRIFDPFFTTKASTTSFGLGLTVSDSLVRGWGGWITVHSRPDKGAVFRIYVPVSETQPALLETATPASVAGRTVLLIDDQLDLLDELKTAMEQSGLHVLCSTSASEGVAMHAKNSESIAVTVTDMVMPGSQWSFVLDSIIGADSQADVIITSGFSRDYVRRSLPRGAWGFLQKPFEASQLVELVIDTIRKRSRGKDAQPVQLPLKT